MSRITLSLKATYRRLLAFWVLIFAGAIVSSGAHALDASDYLSFQSRQDRFALVIGNRNYTRGGLPEAINANHDADEIARLLSAKGFDVVVRFDLTADQIAIELTNLAQRLDAVQTSIRPLGVFYFAGHGFAKSQDQFLAGIDAGVGAGDLTQGSIRLRDFLAPMASRSVFVVYLDACRNEFPGSSPQGIQKISKFNIAKIGRNTDYLVAYAAASGEVALGFTRTALPPDPVTGLVAPSARSKNSPYSGALLKDIARGVADISTELHDVKDDVLKITDEQDAEFTDGLHGTFYLFFTYDLFLKIDEEWRRVLTRPDIERVERYLRRYRNGPLAGAAETWLRDHDLSQ